MNYLCRVYQFLSIEISTIFLDTSFCQILHTSLSKIYTSLNFKIRVTSTPKQSTKFCYPSNKNESQLNYSIYCNLMGIFIVQVLFVIPVIVMVHFFPIKLLLLTIWYSNDFSSYNTTNKLSLVNFKYVFVYLFFNIYFGSSSYIYIIKYIKNGTKQLQNVRQNCF